MEIITQNAAESQKAGKKFAASLKGGEFIALTGGLGAGKTTFVQGIGEYFGIKRMTSPTFILLRKYKISNFKFKISNLFHLDLYRLENNIPEEIENLGLQEEIENPKSVILVEWAEKMQKFLPANTIYIKFDNLSEYERRIKIK